MRVFKTVVMLLAVASFAGMGYAATNLPFTANFDDLAVDAQLVKGASWDYAIAPKGVSGTPDGSDGAIYAADGVTLNIDDPAGSKVWWFSYAKVHAHSEAPAMVDADAAAFYVNTNGQLMAYDQAYDSGNFRAVASGVPTNTWLRFAVRLDYTNRVWDIYMANPHTATLTKRNNLPLQFREGFPEANEEITAVVVSGETSLDAVSVMATSLPIDPNQASAGQVALVEAPVIIEGQASGVSLQYFGTNGTLAGELGLALEEVFGVGDKLHFWDGSITNWVVSTLTALGWDENFTITPTTGFFIERAGATLPLVTSIVSTGTFTHTGVSTTIQPGWNLLAVPYTAGAKRISSLNLSAGANAQVYLWSGTTWSISRYTSLGWSPDILLPAGRTFWLRRRAVGTGSWTW